MLTMKIALWFSALALWLLMRWLLPFLPVPQALFGLTALVVLVISVAWLLWLASGAGRIWTRWQALAGSVIALALWLMTWRLMPAIKPIVWQALLGAIADISLIAAATLLGSLLSSFIRHANLIPPIAVVVTVVDIWTVLLGGFVQQVQQKAPQIVEAAGVKVPIAGSAKVPGIGLPMIGMGDLFFAAFFFALLWRFALNPRISYWLAVLLVLLGLTLAQMPFVPFGLPGLPFLAIAILLPNWRSFSYTSEEKRALIIGGIFFVALLILFALAVRR